MREVNFEKNSEFLVYIHKYDNVPISALLQYTVHVSVKRSHIEGDDFQEVPKNYL